MKSNKDRVFDFIKKYTNSMFEENDKGITTQYLSKELKMQRSNISSILNQLVKENKIEKINGRPVFYRIVAKEGEGYCNDSCFHKLIGYNGSLKGAVQLAKAAILYPQHSLHSLIQGPEGSGKSYFAELMYLFAVENNVLKENSPFIKVNCLDYEGSEKSILEDLFTTTTEKKSLIDKAKGGILFIEYIDKMHVSSRLKLFEYMDTESQHLIIICTCNDSINSNIKETLKSRFPIAIQIPKLLSRNIEERFELIKYFITLEAVKTNKNIIVNSELLYSLLLYNTEYDLKQLMIDIRIGCANSYAREFNNNSSELNLKISDFGLHVRRGLINYKNYREALEKLIPINYLYTFSAESMEQTEEALWQHNKETVYDEIDRKAVELRKHGISEENINMLVGVGIENELSNYTKKLITKKIDYEKLEKIVDKKIISLVKEFLDEASKKLGCVYPISIFYGLCLHISSSLERTSKKQNLSNNQIMEIVEKYKEEYLLSMKFTSKLEAMFNVRLPIDEVIFITMFLSNTDNISIKSRKPMVLVAMHGNNTATSIAEVVNSFVYADNTYSYDLSLDKSAEEAYEELKRKIIDIDQGSGIIMIYDMGSLKTMAELIEQETGIKIKMIEMPLTLVAIDCARKALSESSLENIYHETMASYQYAFDCVKDNYSTNIEEKVIITLCTTGEGGALKIKKYIEKNISLENTQVIPYAISNRDYLVTEINRLKKNSKILCMVGSYDPQLFGIPFIPVHRLFTANKNELAKILNINDFNKNSEKDYDAILEYLKEQLNLVDIELLKQHLPKLINDIQGVGYKLTLDQEIGLFMHVACAIERIIENKESTPNIYKETIISRYKELYLQIKEFIHVLEEVFNITFNDNEIANIMTIIKKL